ncbi:MAG: SUMF1/EgtB/PvdO family nonheme iron enzyme [Bradymonadaceae bacterium]|nr:SUMF1/EgtB/PvdO family nonheme iron enzyme [Lujinxingiaceae bacterium]
MSTCPECHADQPKEAPFCTNCGYRIRRGETMKEGMEAVNQHMLAEYLQNGGRVKPAPSKPRDSRRQSSAKPRTTELEAPAITDEPSTVVEGLRSVRPERSNEWARSGLDEDTGPEADLSLELPAERSGLHIYHPPKASRSRPVLWVALWFGFTAMGILLAYFALDNREAAGPVAPTSVHEASVKVNIAQGPYRRGLSEEVRSFLLQSCHRLHEDPDECEQDRLLKGEYPQQSVEVAAFEIDSKEVTQAQYRACVSAGKCAALDTKKCAVWTPQGLQISLRVPKALQEAQVPVSCLSREEASAYCAYAGGALPTDDQWEKAARGAEGVLFPWGDSWASDLANWGETDIIRTSVVGKLDGFEWLAPPGHYPDGNSPYGLFDMAGNVAEWVQGDDPLNGHARGGSWISNPFELRTTARLRLRSSDRRTDVGFRCAYD